MLYGIILHNSRGVKERDRLGREAILGAVTIHDIATMKARSEKIPMITAYDYTSIPGSRQGTARSRAVAERRPRS